MSVSGRAQAEPSNAPAMHLNPSPPSSPSTPQPLKHSPWVAGRSWIEGEGWSSEGAGDVEGMGYVGAACCVT